jgi:aspartate racemase
MTATNRLKDLADVQELIKIKEANRRVRLEIKSVRSQQVSGASARRRNDRRREMKTLGLIGGTSWVSTVDYYRYLNELTNERLGGANSARLLLYSVNFADFKAYFEAENFGRIREILLDTAKRLHTAGAEAIVLCSNTTHIAADFVQQSIPVPLIHIADATARAIVAENLNVIGLLGTKFTMEREYIRERLRRNGIETIIPDAAQREFINSTIFDELGRGVFCAETKKRYLEIIENLRARGAQGVVFGCTEIPMLIKAEECPIPSFDTTYIHAKYAVDFALSA